MASAHFAVKAAWTANAISVVTDQDCCCDAINPGTVPHRFRKWVTSIVLPAIRKTGQFTAQPCIDAAPAVARTPA